MCKSEGEGNGAERCKSARESALGQRPAAPMQRMRVLCEVPHAQRQTSMRGTRTVRREQRLEKLVVGSESMQQCRSGWAQTPSMPAHHTLWA